MEEEALGELPTVVASRMNKVMTLLRGVRFDKPDPHHSLWRPQRLIATVKNLWMSVRNKNHCIHGMKTMLMVAQRVEGMLR